MGIDTTPQFGCGRCDKRWGGQRTSHCSSCHRTFSGLTAFDTHRSRGHCQPPSEVGLARQAHRPYECWGSPSEEGGEQWWAVG